MQRNTARLVLGLATLLLLSGLLPASAGGQAAAPAVGTPVSAPAAACDPAAFPGGETGITYAPLEDFGFVRPAASPDHNLYMTVDTLPPGSCILLEEGARGAATFLVLEGSIEFLAWPSGAEDPTVQAGAADGTAIAVPFGAPVTLAAGEWVTVDRPADFAFRNPGTEEAVVVTAFYEMMSASENGCAGGCRGRP